MCESWKDFSAFLADMGEAPSGYSLERVNNDIGYSKHNCAWIPIKNQARNRRSCIRVKLFGRSQLVADWIRELGTSWAAVNYWTRKGEPHKVVLERIARRKGITL